MGTIIMSRLGALWTRTHRPGKVFLGMVALNAALMILIMVGVLVKGPGRRCISPDGVVTNCDSVAYESYAIIFGVTAVFLLFFASDGVFNDNKVGMAAFYGCVACV